MLGKVLETDPVNFDSLITLGKLKHIKGEYENARDLFDRALVVRPELEKTMYRLGRVLYDMQQFDRSKLLFEQVRPICSASPHEARAYARVVLAPWRSFKHCSRCRAAQVVQGFQGEIMGDKCDQHTYHNAIAMLGLIHQKAPSSLAPSCKPAPLTCVPPPYPAGVP